MRGPRPKVGAHQPLHAGVEPAPPGGAQRRAQRGTRVERVQEGRGREGEGVGQGGVVDEAEEAACAEGRRGWGCGVGLGAGPPQGSSRDGELSRWWITTQGGGWLPQAHGMAGLVAPVYCGGAAKEGLTKLQARHPDGRVALAVVAAVACRAGLRRVLGTAGQTLPFTTGGRHTVTLDAARAQAALVHNRRHSGAR